MKLFPSRSLELPGGLVVQPSLVEQRVLAAHVMKHVCGLATSRRRAPWDAEGFSEIDPPLVDERRRTTLVAALGEQAVGCLLPEARGKRGSEPEPECYACSRASLCAPHLEPLVTGYLALAESVLSTFEAGVRLPARDVTELLLHHRAKRVSLAECATLVRYRTARGLEIIRATRLRDGLRAELAASSGVFRFRTTYRIPGTDITRLSAALATGGEGGVSDWLTVPRPFAEACGLPLSS